MSAIHVDRCLCHEITFEKLKAIAQSEGITGTDDLQRKVAFGTGCGLCLPYVSVMLRTGRVVFHELIAPGPGSDAEKDNI